MPKIDRTKKTNSPLRLAAFIRGDMEAIISEWVAFARSRSPSGEAMTQLALRDHIVEILNFIADDLQSPQSQDEQLAKSKGDGPVATELHRSAAEIHAKLRLEDGFDIDQMVSEYRALRASVVKQCVARSPAMAVTDVNDLTRFNEAIDQAIAESVAEYTSIITDSRNLFLGIIGHDLRNPIGAASMAGEMLQRLAAPDTKQMALSSNIVDATKRGIQILDDLLDITRSAFGTEIPIKRAPMEMGRLGVDLVNEMRALANGRTLESDIVGDTNGAWDKARIGQVFSNLIGNAVAYSYPESAIFVSVEGMATDVAISVRNQGTPIAPAKSATIFQALMRGQHAETEQRGSSHLGLGLYITKKIVTAHMGVMKVASDQSGTVFTVHLPRQ